MDEMIKHKLFKERELQSIKTEFEHILFHDFKFERLNRTLSQWYNLDWTDFRKELLKAGEKLSFKQQNNLKEDFITKKEKIHALSKEISTVKYDLIKNGN